MGAGCIWGKEDDCLELAHHDPNMSNVSNAALVASSDHESLAVATNSVIRIYNAATKQQITELVGHSSNVWKLYFVPTPTPPQAGEENHDKTAYILISEGAEVSGSDGEILFWYLDSEGRLASNNIMPFAIDDLTKKAVGAIEEDLKTHHELAVEHLHTIQAGFAALLKTADTRNRAHGLPHMQGHFPGFGSTVISNDRQHLLYITHGKTTQHGMRPSHELPQIVVLNLVDRTERCILKGHTDAIMWASWSPDDKTIVTACWDGTYKIWDAKTGDCHHTIGPSGGQNWAGAFSPDGRHVLLSGGSPTEVAVYDLESGEAVSSFERVGKRGSWVRTLAWNSRTGVIAVVEDKSVILWHPFEKKQKEVFRLKNDGSMLDRFCGLSSIEWIDDGRKLVVQTSERTIMVWEPEMQVKWRFQRPAGTEVNTSGDHIVFQCETQQLLSLDGNGKVRYWKL